MNNIAIVGSGFKGIFDALLLSKNKNNNIVLYEKSNGFGGISRSKQILGFNVDGGVHMFDSVQEEVYEIVNEIMSGQIHEIDFNSRSSYNDVVTNGFGLPDLSSCDQFTKMKITHDLLKLASNVDKSKHNIANAYSLKDLLYARYGETAGQIFSEIFKNIYHIDAEECDKYSLNRTSLGRLKYMEDEKMNVLKSNNYLDTILAARRKSIGKIDDLVSFYPSDGNAMGGFCQKTASLLKSRGVEIKLGTEIIIKEKSGEFYIRDEKEERHFNHIYWAADKIDPLLDSLKIEKSIDRKIYHTPMLFAVIKTERKYVQKFTYMQNFSKNSLTFRSSASGVYSNQINDKGETFISVECPATYKFLTDFNPKETIEKIWKEVKDINIIDSPANLLDYKLIPLKASFKVPTLGFSEVFKEVENEIGKYKNKVSLHSPKLFFRRELFEECKNLTANYL